MIDRRRIMMQEASGASGPLYPIPESTTGAFAGTGGNIINYTYGSTGTRFIGAYGKTSSTSASAYNNKTKKFTLPEGSHVVFTMKLLSGSANRVELIVANGTAYVIGRNDSLTVGQTYEVEKDIETDTDVGEIGVRGTTAFQIEVMLTVDGVRYI